MQSPPHSLPAAAATLRPQTGTQLFWRDTVFALASIYLGGMCLYLGWDWWLEALLYIGVMLLLRPLVLRRDDTCTPLNMGYAVLFGSLATFSYPLMFGLSRGLGPQLAQHSGWPLWAALPGMWFLVYNGLTYRLKVYRYWPHPLCIPALILLGIVAMYEFYEACAHRLGLGFTLWAQVAFWVLWSIPLLHDRAIHPRARGWS
jgi:hypothetical protein